MNMKIYNKKVDALAIVNFENLRKSYTSNDFASDCVNVGIAFDIGKNFWNDLIEELAYEKVGYKPKLNDEIISILEDLYDIDLEWIIEDVIVIGLKRYGVTHYSRDRVIINTIEEWVRYIDTGVKLFEDNKKRSKYFLEEFVKDCAFLKIDTRISEVFWCFCTNFYKILYKPKLEDHFFIDNSKIYHDVFIIIAKKYGCPLSLIGLSEDKELKNNRDILLNLQKLFLEHWNQ